MKYDLVKEIKDAFLEIRKDINGHNSAIEKLTKAIEILESSTISDDDILGQLVGEIIWRKHLGRYTEHQLIEDICSKEESEIYNKLNDDWFKIVDENRNLPNSSHSAPEEWNEYRNFARSLHLKYFPHTIKYSTHIPYEIKNKQKFFDGILNFLWNTDECCYVFTIDDIIFEDHRIIGRSLEIEFKLDYTDPKYNL